MPALQTMLLIPVQTQPAGNALAGQCQIIREDALAIAACLKRLTPVSHRVPRNVNPGAAAPAPYVHFGVYQRLP